MENLVPLGTGNSRLMKSNIPASTTLAQLIQMLNNGTFPYDIGPLNPAGISQQGTPLNKATLFKDATASLYGLTNESVPDDALQKIPSVINSGWTLLQEYLTAGAYNWTAPDLFNGKSYTIGVLIIGGGGSGGAATTGQPSDWGYASAIGGASGRSKIIVMIVSPNTAYSVVVGAGGTAVSTRSGGNNSFSNGVNGGTSSFDGNTANGGEGGGAYSADSSGRPYGGSAEPAIGAQCSPSFYGSDAEFRTTKKPFGGVLVFYDSTHRVYGYVNECFNPFTLEPMLGAGASVWGNNVTLAGTDENGLGGGRQGASATAPGCGGGANAYSGSTTVIRTSGAGADGAVKIYIMGDAQ